MDLALRVHMYALVSPEVNLEWNDIGMPLPGHLGPKVVENLSSVCFYFHFAGSIYFRSIADTYDC